MDANELILDWTRREARSFARWAGLSFSSVVLRQSGFPQTVPHKCPREAPSRWLVGEAVKQAQTTPVLLASMWCQTGAAEQATYGLVTTMSDHGVKLLWSARMPSNSPARSLSNRSGELAGTVTLPPADPLFQKRFTNMLCESTLEWRKLVRCCGRWGDE